MKKVLKYVTLALALTIIPVSVQVATASFVKVQATTDVTALNLDVSLGSPNVEGSFVQKTIQLDQANVRETAIEALKKLREEMWDLNPLYNGKPLQAAAREKGLATKEQYATAIKWDQNLEKFAIQRAVEASFVAAHIRPDGTQHAIGFENLAWGYSTQSAINSGWGYEELEDLQKENGMFSMSNGHLHTQLNPELFSFAVAHIEGVTAGAYSWDDSKQLYGTNITGQYVINLKIANELREINGQLGYRGNSYFRPAVTGLVKHTDGQTYYVENGVVKTGFTGLVDVVQPIGTSTNGRYQLQKIKALVRNGKLDESASGLVSVDNHKLQYFKNGFLDTTHKGIVRYNGLLYYVENGVGVLTKTTQTNPAVFSNMYRLYNPQTKRHFYTVHKSEMTLLQSRGWILEGVAWVNSTSTSGIPVYRVWNRQTGERIFTRIPAELEKFKARGWVNEGIAFRMPNDGQKIYRLVNKQTKQYVLSAKLDEIQKLVNSGQWINEGVAFFALFP